jgi:hypothetical protein
MSSTFSYADATKKSKDKVKESTETHTSTTVGDDGAIIEETITTTITTSVDENGQDLSESMVQLDSGVVTPTYVDVAKEDLGDGVVKEREVHGHKPAEIPAYVALDVAKDAGKAVEQGKPKNKHEHKHHHHHGHHNDKKAHLMLHRSLLGVGLAAVVAGIAWANRAQGRGIGLVGFGLVALSSLSWVLNYDSRNQKKRLE